MSIPLVTTDLATSITDTTLTGNGNITSLGGQASCSRRGFCYMTGTTGNPTTANSVAYDDGTFSTGVFTKSITGLTANTAYRIRAYAVNADGTGYGVTRTITTGLPAVDIGPGAVDLPTTKGTTNTTYFNTYNAANADSLLDTFELYAAGDISNVYMGSFYLARTVPLPAAKVIDYEVLGSVTGGSKTTFTGLHCTVNTGNYLGVNWTGYVPGMEWSDSGGQTIYFCTGANWDGTEDSYAALTDKSIAIYATGTPSGLNLIERMNLLNYYRQRRT